VRVRKIGLMKAVYQNRVLKSEMLKQAHDKIDNGSEVWGLGSGKSRSDAAAQEAERSQSADAGQSGCAWPVSPSARQVPTASGR